MTILGERFTTKLVYGDEMNEKQLLAFIFLPGACPAKLRWARNSDGQETQFDPLDLYDAYLKKVQTGWPFFRKKGHLVHEYGKLIC